MMSGPRDDSMATLLSRPVVSLRGGTNAKTMAQATANAITTNRLVAMVPMFVDTMLEAMAKTGRPAEALP